MLDKNDVRDVLLKEIDICIHLHGKLPKGAESYRPTPAQRSTLELAQYLSHCGESGIRALLDGNWSAWEANAKRAATMTLAEFPAEMERQKKAIAGIFETMTPAQFASQEATMPAGEKLKLGRALLEGPMRWMTGYRMQLFLYAKAAGAKEIGTANCWMGIDWPKS